MAKYVLKGTKQQGGRIGSIHVDDERTLVLDGDPVELSEDEHKNLSQSFNLRKVDSDKSTDTPPARSDVDKGGSGGGSLKGGENE